MDVQEFYSRIKSTLLLKDKTVSQLCFSCRIPYQNFVNKKSQKVYPPVTECYRIAKYLNVSLEYLLTGENQDEFIKNYESTVMKDKLTRIAEILNSDV